MPQMVDYDTADVDFILTILHRFGFATAMDAGLIMPRS
ncbi:hypothetical protein ACVW2L_000693 [Mucilaginibacter sp. HD30]